MERRTRRGNRKVKGAREELRNKWNGGGKGRETARRDHMRAVRELRNFATGSSLKRVSEDRASGGAACRCHILA